jgi:hypothetical protein
MTTTLDALLADLHFHGLLNETAFLDVCTAMRASQQPITREQLGSIFGTAAIFHLCTIPDMTARQLVREALDLLTNPETPIDLRDWVRTAEHVVGPRDRRAATDTPAARD